MRTKVIVVAVAGMLFLGGLIFYPSVAIFFEGGFASQSVFTSNSPDKIYEVVASKRTGFPANEVFDPSIVLTISLREKATGKLLDKQLIKLEEESDLVEPVVEWTPRVVHIQGFDRRNGTRLTLHY